jgi:hypothetical protein
VSRSQETIHLFPVALAAVGHGFVSTNLPRNRCFQLIAECSYIDRQGCVRE